MSDIEMKNRAISEASRYLYAILLIVQNKPEGVKIILQSSMDIMRSFKAYIWCLPAQLFMWSLIWRNSPIAKDTSRTDFLLAVSLVDIIAWILFAVAIYAIMILTSTRKLAAPVIITSNWFNLFATYILFIPAILKYALPLGEMTSALIDMMMYLTIVGLYYRVIRHMLGHHKLFAFALTLTSIVINVFVSNSFFQLMLN